MHAKFLAIAALLVPIVSTCPLEAQDEANRRVWIAHSGDEGKTFSRERLAFGNETGACGCCGMRAFADSKGSVYMLYRSATRVVHRDMYLLTSSRPGKKFKGQKVGVWRVPDSRCS